MMTNPRNQDDMDHIDRIEMALHQAKTIFHAQIKEFSAVVVGNDYLETLASMGMDICETALKSD